MARLTTRVELEGNLATEPDLRFTTTDKAVVELRVLVNDQERVDGEWVDTEPTPHNVRAFGRLAENVAESLHRGARVIVIGRMVTDTWVDKTTNEKRTAQKILADVVAPSLAFATVTITPNPRAAS